MISKELKSKSLAILYDVLSDEGKLLKKRQNLNYFSNTTTDDDKYAVSIAVSNILVSSIKSVEETDVYVLVEV